jgi:predicted Fe-Mo cluster-binding NifX family protein
MKIVVSAQSENLDTPTSLVFGRCPTYLFVDTDTMQFEAVANPAMNQGGGAEIQAAQFVVERGAQAVLTADLGPNAFDVLRAAGAPGYLVSEGTVRQAVEAFKASRLQPMEGTNVAAYAGMGGGMGSGAGRVPAFIHSLGADVMLTGGMGGRAIVFFQQFGIEGVTGAHGTVRQSVERYLGGGLRGAVPCRESQEHGHGDSVSSKDLAEGEYGEGELGRQASAARSSRPAPGPTWPCW